MVSLETPVCDFGAPAVDFSLPGVDGQIWTLEKCRGEKGLLVMFICNHCPYVKAVRERIVRDTRELLDYGIKSVAIMSNDPNQYEEDSFLRLQCRSGLTVPGSPRCQPQGDRFGRCPPGSVRSDAAGGANWPGSGRANSQYGLFHQMD